MQATGIGGPRSVGQGAESPITLSRGTGAQRVTDSHGRYMESVLSGNAYRISTAAGAVTAYVGASGGTPLVSVYNPAGSGKNFIFLAAGVANRVTGAAVLSTSFNIWAGVSVANTGTQTAATNVLTNVATGSSAYATSNAATTSSTAILLALPLATYHWSSAVGTYISSNTFDIGGLVVAPPGVLVALGSSVAITSATFDVSLIWEEVPIV